MLHSLQLQRLLLLIDTPLCYNFCMNIAKYQEISGITVDDSDVASINASINRSRITLETMLGYTLKKSKAGINQYEEKGKTTADCIFTGTIFDLDNLQLSDPDPVQGSYRLFSYNKSDQYFKVDPFTKLHAVKLVFIRAGDEPNGITHKTFSDSRMRVQKGMAGISKYIERCKECLCVCKCNDCVQLAVDAEWLNEECVPEDLLYIWADIVGYYSDPKRFITAETLATHSYKQDVAPAPETIAENLAIIQKYAGPYGSVSKTVTI